MSPLLSDTSNGMRNTHHTKTGLSTGNPGETALSLFTLLLLKLPLLLTFQALLELYGERSQNLNSEDTNTKPPPQTTKQGRQPYQQGKKD